MTNDEINEAISAWFEPKPEPLDWVIIDQPIPSAKGFWLHTNSGYERGDVSVTIPLDYFHSEDANARLRDAMLLRVNTPESLELCGEDWWITLQRNIYDRINRRVDINDNVGELYREQMVLAFCAFAGIAHKRDGGET